MWSWGWKSHMRVEVSYDPYKKEETPSAVWGHSKETAILVFNIITFIWSYYFTQVVSVLCAVVYPILYLVVYFNILPLFFYQCMRDLSVFGLCPKNQHGFVKHLNFYFLHPCFIASLFHCYMPLPFLFWFMFFRLFLYLPVYFIDHCVS